MGDTAEVASMEGANWDRLEGGPSQHVGVVASEPHVADRTQTWYGLIRASFDGEPCFRWNMANVAGCNVGPMRTVSDMRTSPWGMPIADVPNRKIHVVMLAGSEAAPTRVAVVDGVVRTGSDDWLLVGVEMLVAAGSRRVVGAEPKPALLPVVTWPTTFNNVHGVAVVEVKPLDWHQVKHPAMLIAHTIGDDEDPAKREFGLVDPGTSFAMIPITIGRMRTQENALVKMMELDSLADISTQIGFLTDDVEYETTGHDEVSAPAEFLASVRSIEGAMAEDQQGDVYESLCWLGSWRPESNTHSGNLRRVSRGLLPSGCYKFATEVQKIRSGYDQTGDDDVSHGMRVLDVGSGDGLVVLCLGAIGARAGWEVRGIELPCPRSCDHGACAQGAWSKWVDTMHDKHPLLHFIAEQATKSVIAADATSDDDDVVNLWKWADVIFMNNLCWGNESVGSIDGCQVTTMSKMMHSLCTHGKIKKPPTLVVTTQALHLSGRTASHGRNERHQPYQSHQKQARMIRTFEIPADGFDWGTADATLRCYVHQLESVETTR